MSKIKYLLFLLIYTKGIAQDPAFSQFYNAKSYLNPAAVGFEPGLSIASNHRVQWINLDRGFITNYVTLEKQEPTLIKKGAIGLGLSVFQTVEGFSGYNRTGAALNMNSIFGNENTTLSGGFNVRWQQERVDPSTFVFSDQLDPIFGNVGSSSFQPNYFIPRSFFDVDAGFLIRKRLKLVSTTGAIYKPMYAFGVSMSNLLGFTQSATNSFLIDQLSGVKPRLTIHGGLEIPVTILKGVGNEIIILPVARLVSQGDQPTNFKASAVQINWGTYLIIKELYLGAFFQSRRFLPDQDNTNSLVAAIGTAIPLANTNKSISAQHKLFIGLSMDVNATGVGGSAGHAYELALRYNFSAAGNWLRKGKRNNTQNRILDCYHFI